MGTATHATLNLQKFPVDETTTLDGTYRIESILDCVNTIIRNNNEPSQANEIIQMLLD